MNEIEQLDKYWFKTTCACGDSNHSIDFILLGDDDWSDEPSMEFSVKVVPAGWGMDKFFKNMWWRVRVAIKLIFLGFIDMEESFMFRDEKQVDAVIKALSDMNNKYKELLDGGINTSRHY
jgi:hypothetical protein